MDFLKSVTGENKEGEQKPHSEQHAQAKPASEGGIFDKISGLASGSGEQQKKSEGQSGGGGFMDKLNELGGGGQKSEANEDAVDKGVDWVQENILKQGAQNNEGAVEQAKDEQISDFIRKQYKGTTGSDMPIKDKEH